jgi:hypothetical protein
MREQRAASLANTSADVEDIDVDLPRTVREGRGAPHPAFDLAGCLQKGAR